MSYKVIVDSCGELTPEMKASGIFETASLTIEVGGHHIVDDETFDQKQFLQYVAEAAECPKSSCPSPEKYMEKYDCDVDRVYAVTLSAELSGSYNSAVLGMNLYHEEHGEKNIHVFNSCSASIGETLIAESVLAEMSDPQNKILAISHCNCPERAEAFKELLVKYATFKDVIVVDTAGISSMYAADGGVIVVV